MECFSGFWSRQPEGDPTTQPWLIGGLHKIPYQTCKKSFHLPPRHSNNYSHKFPIETKDMANVDLRDVVKQKALKHRGYYNSLLEHAVSVRKECLTTRQEMTPGILDNSNNNNTTVAVGDQNKEIPHIFSSTTEDAGSRNSEGFSIRQRKRGVYEIPSPTAADKDGSGSSTVEFKSVKQLREHYQAMLEKTYKNFSLSKEEGKEKSSDLLLPPSSGYCSSSASGASDDEKDKSFGFQKKGLRRSASSDSAVHSDEEGVIGSNWGEKKEEYAPNDECRRCPYSPRGSVDHTNVRSRLLLESKYIPLPVDRKFSVDCVSDIVSRSVIESRRQSCFSEGDEHTRYRYWRTPSVVVSDYSDDIMGLTLEDIEYIRNKREHSFSPCSSMHSSCSNLNYCGSTISVIEGDYVMCKPYRKSSNCSTCSTLSDEEDNVHDTTQERNQERMLQPQRTKEPSGWRKLRNIVQWTPFFQTYKKQRYPWVQLAGHQGNFKAGPDQGTILKKLCAKEEKCFKILMKDVLRPYVPEYKGLVTSDDGECSYIQLQDLLGDFVSPCVMDCKIGVRTYLEEELAKAKEKPKLRKDMYEKMCQIDTNAPTDEEHRLKGVTKPRYMVWRETISSTANLGFRIEGIRNADGTSTKDFKTTKTKEQVVEAFEKFTDGFPHAIPKYIQRLKAIKATLESSAFFETHEMIGSSLLFVHDRCHASVWLIDFAKTVILPDEIKIDHRSKWKVGNHEDGYMIGVNNLIKIFMTILEQQPVTITPPLSLQEASEVVVQQKNEENEDRSDNT